jgi:hypothetical protein
LIAGFAAVPRSEVTGPIIRMLIDIILDVN